MQDLTLVGVHDDGEHLVLAGPDGQRYRVRVDEPLRAAVRRDRPRLGQLQLEMDGALRPREIQSRIRGGESAEQIAADSGLPVEHIRRFEGPVLAEREFVVRQARAVRLRGMNRIDGTVPTLGELVTERLAAREVEHSESSWDAWRVEDGSWLVTLTFTAGTRERRARWTYDTQRRHVLPQDDEARWLSDEPSDPGHGSTSPGAAIHGRLVPLRPADGGHGQSGDQVYDVDAEGTAHLSDRGGHTAAWPPPYTVDLLDSLRERRGRRQRPIEDIAELDDDLPPAAHPPRSRPDQATDAEVLTLPDSPVGAHSGFTPRPAVVPQPAGAHHGADAHEPSARHASGTARAHGERASGRPAQTSFPAGAASPSGEITSGATTQPGGGPRSEPTSQPVTAPDAGRGHPVSAADANETPGEQPGPDREAAERPAASRRSKRASVPSWDDIVFGGRRE